MNNFTQLLALTEELAKALASLPLTVKQKGDLGLLFAAEMASPFQGITAAECVATQFILAAK